MDEFDDIIKEFLIESNENLTQLDQEFVELEQRPDDQELLSSIFRTIHTIKGTCGFLGFSTLESITHRAENLLSQLREGEKRLTPELTTLLLETVDVVTGILGRIEESGAEGEDVYEALRARLQAACDAGAAESPSEPDASDSAEVTEEVSVAEHGAVDDEPAAEVEAPAAPPRVVSGKAAHDAPPEANAAVAESKKPAEGGASRRSVADSTIRVDVDQLDKLMNLAGELVLSRNQILQHAASQDDATLTATSQQLNLITTELQAAVMKTRMQPIGLLWNKFPRVVRDLANSMNKHITLEMEGAETELDKTIIESIKDPLTHIVRNSCDHGIETPSDREAAGKPSGGVLRLRAYHEGGQVNIEIIDDGKGLDPEMLKEKVAQKGLLPPDRLDRMSDRDVMNLIFLPGFSTAQKVTNVSGRGVGMDVVKTNIEKIGGTVDLHSRLGKGTTLKIKIPLTLAIIPALVVSSREQRFAIPQVSLLELVRLEGKTTKTAIEWIHGSPVYRLRGKLLPLVYLNDVLGYANNRDENSEEAVNIVVLQTDERTFGLVVDGIHDTQEIVVKPLSTLLKGLDCYAGATVMGDGRVALILDVFGVAQLGRVLGKDREHSSAAREEHHETTADRQTILLFRSGSNERLAVPLSLVARLEEFPADKIERSRDGMVVQYRGRILPLVVLSEQLGLGPSEATTGNADVYQVIVFSDKEKQVGIVVDQIVDIVEDVIKARTNSERAGIVGSGVVGERVTDFLDLQYLIETFDSGWFGAKPDDGRHGARVLIAEGSPFSRSILRSYLEMNGYRVLEAGDGEQALRMLSREQVDILLSSLDLPGVDAFEVLRRIREEPSLARLPVVALAHRLEETEPSGEMAYQFDDYQLIHNRQEMLQSIERLAAALEQPELVEQEA